MAYSNVLANFDLDGTLTTMWEVHTAAYVNTVEELYGVKGFNFRAHYEPGGTIQETVVSNLRHMGYGDDFIAKGLERVPELMASNYLRLVVPGSVKVLPGARRLLQRLSEESILAGVLTGNNSGVADLIVKHSGLGDYLSYVSTADDGSTRKERMLSAIGKAERISGFTYDLRNIFFFDDSSQSIPVSKEVGIRSIAVATGEASKELLAKARPDHMLDDLTDTEGIIAMLKEAPR
jgi:phosphoglycolate phosphatase-like HAD superfamily hydrolase